MNVSERRMERANIPFSDPEAFAQYYIVCLKENKKRLAALFRGIEN